MQNTFKLEMLKNLFRRVAGNRVQVTSKNRVIFWLTNINRTNLNHTKLFYQFYQYFINNLYRFKAFNDLKVIRNHILIRVIAKLKRSIEKCTCTHMPADTPMNEGPREP